MSILSWNCQGAGSTKAVRRLREIRKNYFPDFLFLSETKQRFGYMDNLKKSFGYEHMITVEPVGLSGGLAVMWKNSFDVEVLVSDRRIIDLKVKMGSLLFFLTCVYGEPVRAMRNIIWDRLVDIGIARDEARVLVGDFNELLKDSEKVGGPTRAELTFWDFRNMVESCKVKELRSSGNVLSWAGWRDQIWVQCRLDRSFGNDEWFQLFPRARMEYMEMRGSDHRPIQICFAYEEDEQGRGRFYIDKRILSKEGIEEIIKRSWNKQGMSSKISLMDRISNCRTNISRWKKTNNFNSKNRLQRLQHELEREITKISPCRARMQSTKREIAKAYKEEEIFWQQKSRDKWLQLGDKNNVFFHNSMKGQKTQNKTIMLIDVHGREIFLEGSKGTVAVEYFRELFVSTNPLDLESLFEGFQSRVTSEMKNALTAQITTEEIKKAAFGVDGRSAPGADGFTGIF